MITLAVLSLLPLLLLFAVCGESSSTTPAALPTRHIPLEGQPNFRDLGGYRTTDGRKVKRGLLYRSGELSKLSDDDVAALERLGVRTVADFRSSYEIETRGEDRLPAGATSLPLAIESGDLATVLTKALASGDVSALPDNVLAEANRIIVRDATSQYRTLFEALADPGTLPLVVHCTHGKDRAGVAAAVVLMALGVPAQTAREDYLRSNFYRKEENDRELARIRLALAQQQGVTPAEVDLEKLETLFWLDDAYFDALLDEIATGYGSFDGYLDRGLGVSSERVAALRARFTE